MCYNFYVPWRAWPRHAHPCRVVPCPCVVSRRLSSLHWLSFEWSGHVLVMSRLGMPCKSFTFFVGCNLTPHALSVLWFYRRGNRLQGDTGDSLLLEPLSLQTLSSRSRDRSPPDGGPSPCPRHPTFARREYRYQWFCLVSSERELRNYAAPNQLTIF